MCYNQGVAKNQTEQSAVTAVPPIYIKAHTHNEAAIQEQRAVTTPRFYQFMPKIYFAYRKKIILF